MIVVSGLRRSGTSMMMLALKKAGFDIAGFKFATDSTQRQKDNNPNGYWEVERITKEEGLTDKCGSLKGEVVKIMFEALSFSNPKLIDKVIVIFREPRRVLYSIMKHNVIDYRDIFILKQSIDTIDAFEYLHMHNIPYKIVIYEKILKEPLRYIREICEFMGKGGEKRGAGVIDSTLNRSPRCESYKYVSEMEAIYRWAKRGKINKILNMVRGLRSEAKILIDNYDNEKNNKI